MGNFGIYDFGAGINYRDKARAINELSTALNVRWVGGALARRKGYASRAATLNCSAAYASGDCLNILKQLHYHWLTQDTYLLFVSIDSGGGSVADKVVVFYNDSGVPGSAVTFSVLGSGYSMAWTADMAFQVAQVRDKVYVANGQPDPYVLHRNTGGSAWLVTELPICKNNNASASNGWGTAANYIIDNDDWLNCKWVAATEEALYVGNEDVMFFAIAGVFGTDPGESINSGASSSALRTAILNTWDPLYYKKLESQSEVYSVSSFKSYLFLAGQKGAWRWLNRNWEAGDIFLDKLSGSGVRSNICTTSSGVFWVGPEGIFYHDSQTAHNISLKIWDHITAQHSSLPSDLDDVTLTAHKGWVWISFPNSTDKEVWALNPRSIYQGQDGEYYGVFFKCIYCVTDLDTEKDFSHLYETDDHLFATDGAKLYELETGFMDNQGSSEIGINVGWETADLDFGEPGRKKRYGYSVLELSPNLETKLAHTISFERDYGEEATDVTGIDTTYTGAKRAHVEFNTPYQADGNALKIGVAGNASGLTASGEVEYFGVSIETTLTDKTKKEVS